MDDELENLLIQATEDACIGTVRSYSGRGMYGKTCVGLEVNTAGEAMEIAAWAVLNADGDSRDVARMLGRAREDSMGRGVILYWPTVPPSPELEARELEE